MISVSHRPRDLLDDAGDGLHRLWQPWLGLLWVCELPLAASLVLIGQRLLILGSEARAAGAHLLALIILAVCCWPLAVYGRARYAQALVLGIGGGRALPARLPALTWRRFLFHQVLTTGTCLLCWLGGLTLVPLLLLPWASAFATALAAQCSEPRLAAAWQDGITALARVGVLSGLVLSTGLIGFFLFLNLHGLATGLVGLAGAWGAWRFPDWIARLAWGNPLYLMLLLVASRWLLQPILIGTMVSHVFRVRARRNGDDLQAWLRELAERP